MRKGRDYGWWTVVSLAIFGASLKNILAAPTLA